MHLTQETCIVYLLYSKNCAQHGEGDEMKDRVSALKQAHSQTQSRVMSIWLYGSRGGTSNLDHCQERLKNVKIILELRLQGNLGVY